MLMLDTDFAILDASACGELHSRVLDERLASESAQPSDALWSGTADTTAASAPSSRLLPGACV
jgi:hypothetical protein